MNIRNMIIFLLAIVGLAACGGESQSQPVFIEPAAAEEVRTETTTTVSPTTVAPTTEPESAPEAPEAPEPVVAEPTTPTTEEVVPWVNNWPTVGNPVRVKIFTGEGWNTIDIPVYQHVGTNDEGDLDPKGGQAANWDAQGFSNPGEEGYSMLAGHQSQVFEALADGGMPAGTKIEILTDLDQTIYLTTLSDPRDYYKSEESAEGRTEVEVIPWDEITSSEMGESITTLITCGDASDAIRSDGYSAQNYIVRAQVDKIVEADGTEFVPWG